MICTHCPTFAFLRFNEGFWRSFHVDDQARFGKLQTLWAEVKQDKDAENFRDDVAWLRFIPDEAKSRFYWPSAEERRDWLAIRDTTPIAISSPPKQLGTVWNFFSVIESLKTGEYTLLACEQTDDGNAEMKIDPWAYPYGGLGPLIALVEAFGFPVVGVNEYGRYLDRNDLSRGNQS